MAHLRVIAAIEEVVPILPLSFGVPWLAVALAELPLAFALAFAELALRLPLRTKATSLSIALAIGPVGQSLA